MYMSAVVDDVYSSAEAVCCEDNSYGGPNQHLSLVEKIVVLTLL